MKHLIGHLIGRALGYLLIATVAMLWFWLCMWLWVGFVEWVAGL